MKDLTNYQEYKQHQHIRDLEEIIKSLEAKVKEQEKQLSLIGVSYRFKTIADALGYLNRSGYRFKERMLLSDETIIRVANDIYNSTTIKKEVS